MIEYPLDAEESWERCGWESKEAQLKRFEVLCEIGLPENGGSGLDGKRILDYGCGDGELYSYLLASDEHNPEYYGVDKSFDAIQLAHRRFDRVKRFFWTTNVDATLGWTHLGQAYDYIFASGVFNEETGDNEERAIAFLREALESATIGVAANFLWDGYPHRHPDYHMFNWEKMAATATTFAQDVKVRIGYLPNDFTVYLTC